MSASSLDTALAPTTWQQWTTPFVFFTGKGGVGKTTAAATSAVALADADRRVLLVSTDPASNLGDVLGVVVGDEPVAVDAVPGLAVMDIDPEQAAEAFKERVVGPYRGLLPDSAVASMEEQLSGACTLEIAAFDQFTGLLADPAVTERYDHVVFDTAPTGHTLRLLSLPSAWTGFIDENPDGASCLGPLAGLQAQQERYAAAVDALGDADRTTVALVARADAGALAEAERAGSELAELGIANQMLLVNGVLGSDDGDPVAGALRARQQEALAARPQGLADLTTHVVPLVPAELTGVDALRALAGDAASEQQPEPSNVVAAGADDGIASLVDELEVAGPHAVLTMGKGGVGKTTVAAAVAVALADRGHDVILSTTDPAAHLTQALDGASSDRLTVERIDPAAETERYAAQVMESAKDLDADTQALLEEDLASPCTEEIAVFQAFARTVARAGETFVVLDTAPTGHTLLLLDASESYHRQVANTGGDVPEAVRELLPRLRDQARTRLVLVTLAESTPVQEAARLDEDLRRAGITPFGWVVNATFSASGTRHPVLRSRALLEQQHLADVGGLADRRWVTAWRPEPPVGLGGLRDFVA